MLGNAMGGFDPGRSDRPHRRSLRALAVLTAVTLVLGLAGAYQVGVRSRREPVFTVGGGFGAGSQTGGKVSDAPLSPDGDPSAASTTTPTTAAPEPAPGAAATPTPAAPATTVVTTAPGAATAGPAAPAGPALPAVPVLPATGTYTYALQGSERATGFGSRSFPGSATVVAKRDASVRADELVHDIRLSGQHEERAVVRYSADGIAFSFEGGSITFAPTTQTSQATYQPPMVQIPWPLADGASRSGSTSALDAAGNVSRVERWTTTVVGREVLTVLGQARETWVVDIQRTTEPGAAEQLDRFRRYWYDPVLGTWVRWTERLRGQRNVVLTFVYENEYTAELSAFTAG